MKKANLGGLEVPNRAGRHDHGRGIHHGRGIDDADRSERSTGHSTSASPTSIPLRSTARSTARPLSVGP